MIGVIIIFFRTATVGSYQLLIFIITVGFTVSGLVFNLPTSKFKVCEYFSRVKKLCTQRIWDGSMKEGVSPRFLLK